MHNARAPIFSVVPSALWFVRSLEFWSMRHRLGVCAHSGMVLRSGVDIVSTVLGEAVTDLPPVACPPTLPMECQSLLRLSSMTSVLTSKHQGLFHGTTPPPPKTRAAQILPHAGFESRILWLGVGHISAASCMYLCDDAAI